MFKSKLYLVSASIVTLALVTGACAQPEPTPTTAPTLTGTLNVYVTDAPAPEEVTSIMVTVAEVKAHIAGVGQEQEQQPEQSGNGEWMSIDIDDDDATFNLLEIAGIEQFLGASEVTAGKYTQVRLVVDTIQVRLGDGELEDATVSSNELKLVRPFHVTAGETTNIILDFDADKMVTVTGTGKIMVKPVIKLSVKYLGATGEPKQTEEEVTEEMVEVEEEIAEEVVEEEEEQELPIEEEEEEEQELPIEEEEEEQELPIEEEEEEQELPIEEEEEEEQELPIEEEEEEEQELPTEQEEEEEQELPIEEEEEEQELPIEEEEEEEEPPEEIEMEITSAAFQDGEAIPTRYACDGQDISPALSWSGVPEGTQSFVLIVDDPDAPGGTFTHWVIFNIPADTTELEEAIPTSRQLPSGALQGRNGFAMIGYGGPCPPLGRTHRYRFIIYALDQPLNLTAGASKQQVLNAMNGHILAQAQLTGTYQR